MKQDKDWIDVMRSTLSDAELPPPSGGWQRLERELGSSVSTPPARRVIYWPRITAAAAAVLICVVLGEFLWHTNQELDNNGVVIATAVSGSAAEPVVDFVPVPKPLHEALVAAVGMPTERNVATESSTQYAAHVSAGAGPSVSAGSSASSDLAVLATANITTKAHNHADASPAAVSDADAPPIVEPTSVWEAASNSVQALESTSVEASKLSSTSDHASAQTSDASGTSAQSKVVAHPKSRVATNLSAHTSNQEPFVAYVAPRKKASLSLFAGGTMTGGTTTNGVVTRALSSLPMADASSGLSYAQSSNYNDYSFRHHQPLSFGISARKEFAYGLSLESGVNYTYLGSEVRLNSASEDVSQQLHFIGIPLRLNWQFFQSHGFSLYTGVGALAEKCILAKFGSKSIAEQAVQWSASAAVGAQYNLTPLVGLYFEPEVSYYFTKTELRTARTESPMTFTLRLGVRFTF